jgi:hypothetical protein
VFYDAFHPTIWDVVEFAKNYYNEESGKHEPLIGERETLCTGFVSFVCAEQGVIIRSYAGTGKTATANPIYATIPSRYKHRILNLSGKGIWSDVDQINNAKFVYFGEWQKAAQNEDVVEVVKDWGEGRTAERSRTDVTTTNDSGGFGKHTTKLPKKPILVTVATADGKDDSSLNEQVLRRFPEVATDPSQSQTQAVIDMKGDQWDPGTTGFFTMSSSDKDRFVQHVDNMINDAPRKVILPGGKEILRRMVPTDYPISRSMSDIFKNIVNGITRFHFYDRIRWADKDNVEHLIATPADFWIAQRIYGNNLLLNCLRISNVGREIMDVLPKIQTRNPTTGQYVATHDDKLDATSIRKQRRASR